MTLKCGHFTNNRYYLSIISLFIRLRKYFHHYFLTSQHKYQNYDKKMIYKLTTFKSMSWGKYVIYLNEMEGNIFCAYHISGTYYIKIENRIHSFDLFCEVIHTHERISQIET